MIYPVRDNVWWMRGCVTNSNFPLQGVTCLDDGCRRVRSQQAQHIKITLVQHVVLKIFQCQGRLKKLPVTVIWEVIVDEQSRVSQKIKLIVPGTRRKRLKGSE